MSAFLLGGCGVALVLRALRDLRAIVDWRMFVPPSSKTWHDDLMDATLVLGQQGRLVIPADVRAALGLAPGDHLHLHVAGSRLVLERQRDAVEDLRTFAKDVPKSRSFVDELLAERRLAAATE